jgi:cobalt-zinc-cadmium efflux system outer membrane protein
MKLLFEFSLLCSLTIASISAQAQTQAQTHAEIHPDIYPSWLPPASQVNKTLENLPQLRASRANLTAEKANAERLRVGPHEWIARTSGQQRRENLGTHYFENEIAIERAMRYSSKADKDIAIGKNSIEVADAALADSWHEAARSLMALWFNWLREERQTRRLQEYAQILNRELSIAVKRVNAGDAPRMEIMLAETELAKAQAAQLQAFRRTELLAAELEKKFPGIALYASTTLVEPPQVQGNVAEWREKILTDNHELELAERTAQNEKLIADRILLEKTPDPTIGVRMVQERGGSERILGLTLSMPIPGEYRRRQAEVALARADAAQERAQEIRAKVEAMASQVSLTALSAKALWQTMANIATQTETNARLASRAYALGEASLAETLLARRHAIEALNFSEQAQLDALEAYSRLLLDTHAIWSLHEGHEHY